MSAIQSNLKSAIQRMRVRLKYPNVKIQGSATLRSVCEGGNLIGKNTHFDGSIGYGSYIGSNCEICASIGRYTSIGNAVSVVMADHPLEPFASTHPAFFSTRSSMAIRYANMQKFNEYRCFDEDRMIGVCIGSDVWIGNNVTILGGISIGDGAVVATGAVVTKSIPPYAIVGGVPARLIRMRFTEAQRISLLDLKWWDRGEDWIRAYCDAFDNVDRLIEELKKQRSF